MTALLEGQSYAAIARRRRRSVSTVAKQAGSAFRKLGVSSRTDAVRRAVELGLLDQGVLAIAHTVPGGPRSTPAGDADRTDV